MNPATLLVCGATGQVGAAVCEQLDAMGVAWVGLSRKPSKAARFRQADFADSASLPPVLAGINTVLLACSDQPNQDALEINMINACRAHGVRHVVKLSAQSAGLQPPVSFGRLHTKAEQALRDSGMAWTFLRPVFFMQSLLFFADSIKSGKLIAATGKGKVAWVDVRDVAEVAAAVLTNPARHAGKIYTLTGAETHSFAEVTQMLSTVIGRPVKHISPPAWFAKLVLPLASGMPRWQSNMAVELMAAIRRGAQQDVSTDACALLRQKPRAIEAVIAENLLAWGGSAGQSETVSSLKAP